MTTPDSISKLPADSEERYVAPIVRQLALDDRVTELINTKNQALASYPDNIIDKNDPNVFFNPNVKEVLDRVFRGGDYQKALEDTIDDTAIYIVIKASNIKKVIKDGRFKNSLETGKGSFKTIGEERRLKIEEPVFGITPDYPVEDAPKYGFLAGKENMDSPLLVNAGYGNVFVRFKPDVKSRATFTVGDSFDGNDRNYRLSPASSLSAPESTQSLAFLTRKDPGNLYVGGVHDEKVFRWLEDRDYDTLRSLNPGSPYLEVQIYGPLTMDDVDAMEVTSRKLAGQLQRMLVKAGYNDVDIVPALYDERLDHVQSRDWGNKIAPLNAEDIDLLPGKYLDGAVDGVGTRLFMSHPEVMDIIVGQVSKQDVWNAMKKEYAYSDDNLRNKALNWTKKRINDRNKSAEQIVREWQDITSKHHTVPGDLFRYWRDGTDDESKRNVLKLIYDELATQRLGVLEPFDYKDFRPSMVGWVKDVYNEDLVREQMGSHGIASSQWDYRNTYVAPNKNVEWRDGQSLHLPGGVESIMGSKGMIRKRISDDPVLATPARVSVTFRS